MIPAFNQSGVLPPFIAEQGSTDPAKMSPYKASIKDFVCHYATTPERIKILDGFLRYRNDLRNVGIVEGFQWVDGSFVENVEQNRDRAPADIDLVTFAMRPNDDLNQWKKIVIANHQLFHPQLSKQQYLCDAYFVDLGIHPYEVVNQTRYWFGLFSHQRDSSLWKGMIEIQLSCTDDDALTYLKSLNGESSNA